MVDAKDSESPPSVARESTLPKEENWHFMQESEDLQTPDGPGVAAEEIFNAIAMIVPFSFLLLMMEILIRYQYGKHPGLNVLVEQMVSNVPILALLIFYTMRYKQHRRLQIGFFLASIGIGCRTVYLLSRGSLYVNIRQVGIFVPVATCHRLELGTAVLNLAVVSTYVWWKGLKLLR
ncbi:uncharacterized protein BT62DRAFT_1000259 [Guyanagaster necrorhizus]|uniref:DUF7719 domain-containing protein n=1 Tax=Guyanagaster necrorhizus TaxID=856835 RepID=A0A9P7W1T9_9AGAR|nr:uncharacterized protein BT62DRAFT_1000259 [Guyanagaster necrorhizus MCA 3950]KAG7451029.1 hypothetical protein BT62DRAFT_1000259 [Guyanagaster necrorhizus MCA 3950]